MLTLWQIHWPWQPYPATLARDRGVACLHRSSTDVPLATAASACLSSLRTITWASQLTAGTAILLNACQEMGGGAVCQRAGAEDRCVGTLVFVHSGKCWGQENRCSKVRRCPRWLGGDGATTASAKISKLKQVFPSPAHNSLSCSGEVANVLKNESNERVMGHLF